MRHRTPFAILILFYILASLVTRWLAGGEVPGKISRLPARAEVSTLDVGVKSFRGEGRGGGAEDNVLIDGTLWVVAPGEKLENYVTVTVFVDDAEEYRITLSLFNGKRRGPFVKHVRIPAKNKHDVYVRLLYESGRVEDFRFTYEPPPCKPGERIKTCTFHLKASPAK